MNSTVILEKKPQADVHETLQSLKKDRSLRKPGIAGREFAQLLLHKVGVTDKEIKDINRKSLQHAKKSTDEYEKLVVKGNPRLVRLANAFAMGEEVPLSFYSGDLPFPNPVPVGPPDLRIEPNQAIQHGVVHAEGNGLGWMDDDSRSASNKITFNFPRFHVPVDGFYLLKLPVIAVGQGFLYADDVWYNSKNAEYAIGSEGQIAQQYPTPRHHFWYGTPRPAEFAWSYGDGVVDPIYIAFITRGDDNIHSTDPILATNTHFLSDSRLVWLYHDLPIDVTLYCFLNVAARGEGSVAEINCSKAMGGVICPHVSLWRMHDRM